MWRRRRKQRRRWRTVITDKQAVLWLQKKRIRAVVDENDRVALCRDEAKIFGYCATNCVRRQWCARRRQNGNSAFIGRNSHWTALWTKPAAAKDLSSWIKSRNECSAVGIRTRAKHTDVEPLRQHGEEKAQIWPFPHVNDLRARRCRNSFAECGLASVTRARRRRNEERFV